jgi:hypothetical protein
MSAGSFFDETIRHLARALAQIDEPPWEKVERLLRLCPSHSGSSPLMLTCRGREALVALLIFLNESKLKHKKRLTPYLLDIMNSLPSANWLQSGSVPGKSGQHPCQQFVYRFIVLLLQVAALDSSLQNQISSSVLQLLHSVTDMAVNETSANKGNGVHLFICVPTQIPVFHDSMSVDTSITCGIVWGHGYLWKSATACQCCC